MVSPRPGLLLEERPGALPNGLIAGILGRDCKHGLTAGNKRPRQAKNALDVRLRDGIGRPEAVARLNSDLAQPIALLNPRNRAIHGVT